MLLTRLEAAGLSRKTLVVNDAAAALRSGTRQGWGISLVCGAGVNGYGRAPGGRTARFDALGEATGDWGGGGAVGLAALGAAVRAKDGRSIRTTLEQLIPAHFGLPRPSSVGVRSRQGAFPTDDWTRLRRSCSKRRRQAIPCHVASWIDRARS